MEIILMVVVMVIAMFVISKITPEKKEVKPPSSFNEPVEYRPNTLKQPVVEDGLPRDYTVIDVETTGLDEDTHCIVQIAALRVRDGKPTESFNRLVKLPPKKRLMCTEFHGITREMLKADGVSQKQALDEFLEFCGSDWLVAYNAEFDVKFIKAMGMRERTAFPHRNVLCALRLAKEAFKLRSYKLGNVASHLGIDASGWHNAVEDCVMAHKIFEAARGKV